jgi:hypothetical protein
MCLYMVIVLGTLDVIFWFVLRMCVVVVDLWMYVSMYVCERSCVFVCNVEIYIF